MYNLKKCRLLPMDELQNRPCMVDGVPALFHRWVEADRVLFRVDAFVPSDFQDELLLRYRRDGVIPPGCSVEVIRDTFALVEYRDGVMAKMDPELVRFVEMEELIK